MNSKSLALFGLVLLINVSFIAGEAYTNGDTIAYGDIIRVTGTGFDCPDTDSDQYVINFKNGIAIPFHFNVRVFNGHLYEGLSGSNGIPIPSQISKEKTAAIDLEFLYTDTHWEVSSFGQYIPELDWAHDGTDITSIDISCMNNPSITIEPAVTPREFMEFRTQCDNYVYSIQYSTSQSDDLGGSFQDANLIESSPNSCYGACSGVSWAKQYITQIPADACRVRVECGEAGESFFIGSLEVDGGYISTGDEDNYKLISTTGTSPNINIVDATIWERWGGTDPIDLTAAPYNALPIWTCGVNGVFDCGDKVRNVFELDVGCTAAVVRDCSVLAIDEFLLQCSTEFPEQSDALYALETGLTTAKTNIGTNTGNIAQNAADIAQIQTDAASGGSVVTAQIEAINGAIEAINTHLSLFAAQSQIGMIDSENNIDGLLSSFDLSFKDLFVISLLLVNLIIMCCIHCKKASTKGEIAFNKQYAAAVQYDQSDEEALNQ